MKTGFEFSPGQALVLAGALVLADCARPMLAQSASSPVWRYTLLPESRLIDDCLVCGRPAILMSLQGTFDLQLLEESPLFSRYAVTHVNFSAVDPWQDTYSITGHGEYEIGGEVALLQSLTLELAVGDGLSNRVCFFTNRSPNVERLWPMLRIMADQTNGTPLQTFALSLSAAPLRELWFSTANGLTPGVPAPVGKPVSAGDLASTTGRVVKRNHELTAHLGIMPMVPDLGLDAAGVRPGGGIFFSVEEDVFSESLGPLHHGDLLSERGSIVLDYADLSGAFGPEPPPADQGLDAVQVRKDGEVWFSVESDFFSESLGRTIRKGDLLSSRGQVLKTNEELLARFAPSQPKDDYGLDAVYVWPSGEVWFSVERGFYGPHFETYGPGDVLSDQGYVVFRNLDLLSPFQPLEDLADFGLDALFIVSDAEAREASVAAPRCLRVAWESDTKDLRMDWSAPGRVFQLERATNLSGPWQVVGPIVSEPPGLDPEAITNAPQGFYRLRQW